MSQPDTLTQDIGVLKRREVEARILAPVINAMSEAFGRDEVLAVLAKTIVKIAREQGAEMAASLGANDARTFMASLEAWTRGGALELDVLNNTQDAVAFDVKRCRYAQMYRDLGIPELGAILSCNRDFAMIEGFAPDAELNRTRTILGGAAHCDFRYKFPAKQPD
ncbi:MAG: hypothetical protein GKR94_32380 [Gammaproteobacteria bacterium]|nr:hypothetical protein [Gammaproteobacteria bacterium]